MEHIVKPCVFDYNTNKRIIEELIKEYPFLNVQVIGRSALGRGIFALEIGNNKNCVIYVGSVAGSDSLSGLLLLLFTERLCYTIKNQHLLCSVDVGKAFSKLGVTIIPCLNPDGREICLKGAKSAKNMASFVSSFSYEHRQNWIGNALGVDISHNFAKGSPDSLRCSPFTDGDYPESEAETKAITRLCRLKKYRQCMELKSGEGRILWNTGEIDVPRNSMMAKILAGSCSLPLWDDNENERSFRQWFINETGNPGFTFEFTEDTNKGLYSIYAELEEALTVFSLM